MAIKRYFNGTHLIEVELPDAPFPEALHVRGNGPLDAIAALNPTGVDTTTLAVNPADLPNLIPTPGAVASQLIKDRPPGTGEGPAVGLPSGSAVVDPWANNPNRPPQVEPANGEIGDNLTGAEAAAARITNLRARAAAGDKRAAAQVRKIEADEAALAALV